MRQILFRIWLDHPWALWTPRGDTAYLGAAWVVLAIVFAFVVFHVVRREWAVLKDPASWIMPICGLLFANLAGRIPFLPESFQVFGYGMMMLIGFLTAMWFSSRRAEAVGYDPNIVVDAATWVLLIGILGGRTAYVMQYSDRVFEPGQSFGQMLFAFGNLTNGGLVQIGGLLGGTLGFLIFSYRRQVNFYEFADIFAPAIFIGIGFGRLGCLLNGCCYGDRCELPWGIEFPAGSSTFAALVEKGFLAPDAVATFPLHPTQIYSSINGFVLAFVTAAYYWYRQYNGDVFGVGCILYGLTRVQLEFLRADEMGQLGTGFTISQFYSGAIILFGIALLIRNRWMGTRATSPPASADAQPAPHPITS